MADPIYEIHAKGRDTLTYMDPTKAGEAFYSVRREDLPKALRFDGPQDMGTLAAATAQSGAGHEHLLLDADEKFRAGYAAARERMPQKAIPLQDMQQPAPQPTQGQSMPDQQAPATQQPAADTAPARLQIGGQEVMSIAYEKSQTALGPRYDLTAHARNGEVLLQEKHVAPEMLPEVVGEKVAQTIINNPEKSNPIGLVKGRLVGENLYGPATEKTGLPRVGGDLDRTHDVQINGRDVGSVSYSRIHVPTGTVYDLKVFDHEKNLLSEQRDVPAEVIADKLGTRIADAVLSRPFSNGVIQGELINDLGRSDNFPVKPSNAWHVAIQPEGMKHPSVTAPAQAPAADLIKPQQEPEKVQAPVRAAVPTPDNPQQAEQMGNTISFAAAREPEKAPAASQPAQQPTREQLRASLEQRFEVASVGTLLKPADEYRFKGDGPLRIAFTDHGKQMSTSLDTKEVVKAMADLAQAKGWREINANGTPEFKRQMWMEGNLRGIHVAGYSPSKEDHERLRAARDELAQQRQPKPAQEAAPKNTVEAGATQRQEKQQEQAQKPVQAAAPAKEAAQGKEAAPAQAQGSTRAQYLMAAKSVLTEQGVDSKTIDKAMQSLGVKLDAMLAAGKTLPTLHVFDRAAPSLQPVPTVTVQPTVQPGREVAAPGR